MSASLGLFRLQQIDSQIGQIETRLAEIQKVLEDDAKLREARELVGAAEEEQRAAERAQHQSEDDAQSQQIKIQQAESSLYGGTVRNPKELQDLQADVGTLKKHLATLEELELQDMLRTENAQAAVKEAQGELSRVEMQRSKEHSRSFEEKESLTLELNRLQSEREAAVGAIAADRLKIYDELRQLRRGVAVAEVSDNACGACGITLTAAIQQTARHASELVHCPACGRILYAV
ncbi:MAG TPA: C4-type zinc ribbon domain-containing protein [Anaerolineales bacterium]|nr:C4-type zinc ribbon domain-containing protein [Anaerolineales bacterium]